MILEKSYWIPHCAGTQFDPMIAEAFAGMPESGRREYMD